MDIRNWRSLEILRLSHNNLQLIPKSIRYLTCLQELDISNNQLTSGYLPIPETAPLNLKSVNLDGNSWRLPPLGSDDARNFIIRTAKSVHQPIDSVLH